MIKPLHTLKDNYRKKNIYIWNINHTSTEVLMLLLFNYIDICGFIDPSDKYVDEELFNRPIYSKDILSGLRDDTIVVYKENAFIEPYYSENKGIFVEVWSLFGSINPDLYNKKVYIYGTGGGAGDLLEEIKREEIVISGFVETEQPIRNVYNNLPLKSFKTDDFTCDDAIIISPKSKKDKMDILEHCKFADADVFLDYYSLIDFFVVYFALVVNRAIKSHKQIVLCGEYNALSDTIYKIFEIYEIISEFRIHISEKVEPKVNNKIKSLYIYDIRPQDVDKCIVVVDEILSEKQVSVISYLQDMGWSVSDMNITGFFECNLSDAIMLGKSLLIEDNLVRVSMHSQSDDLSGWKCLGKTHGEEISIAILGGSTSSAGYYRVESWGEKLHRKLLHKGYHLKTYIGATPGATVSYEIVKFLRDGYCIKPDIVISMSGVNNTLDLWGYNQFSFLLDFDDYNKDYLGKIATGLRTDENNFDYWIRCSKVLKLLASHIGAECFVFLQPMNLYMENMSLDEKMIHEYEIYRNGAIEFYQKAGETGDYFNLIEAFQHKDKMYIDCWHYSEYASNILADRVIEIIEPALEKLGRRR